MKVGRLLLRVAVGGFFVGHGTQKLFGWFGGHGLKATAAGFDSMGIKPGQANAVAAGAAEAAGGAALAVGYQTPLASAALISVMLTAINRVHLKNGPWSQNGGYEYNVVLLAAAAALAESGPGALSLDALRGKQKEGAKWGLFALAAGAAGAAGHHFLIERQAAKTVVPPVSTNGTAAAAGNATPEPTSEAGTTNGSATVTPAPASEEGVTEPATEADSDNE